MNDSRVYIKTLAASFRNVRERTQTEARPTYVRKSGTPEKSDLLLSECKAL